MIMIPFSFRLPSSTSPHNLIEYHVSTTLFFHTCTIFLTYSHSPYVTRIFFTVLFPHASLFLSFRHCYLFVISPLHCLLSRIYSPIPPFLLLLLLFICAFYPYIFSSCHWSSFMPLSLPPSTRQIGCSFKSPHLLPIWPPPVPGRQFRPDLLTVQVDGRRLSIQVVSPLVPCLMPVQSV